MLPYPLVQYSLWTLQRIAEHEFQRKIYTSIKASNLKDHRGRLIDVGNIEIRNIHGPSQGAGVKGSTVRATQAQPSISSTVNTIPSFSQITRRAKLENIDSIRFSFVQTVLVLKSSIFL